MHASEPVVAILHQAVPPVDHSGIVKAPKPGGYRDSGADIAFALRQAGVTVVTPEQWPGPALDTGWTFPDTAAGIAAAVQAGATTLWANTVLFTGHPLEQILGRVRIVGQIPAVVDRYDA
ncbi:MAG: biotin carboxylase, partial [Chloroflexota bacterium]|nr:biotin carboxylase [Chloroflexota bacterium]